MKMEEDTAEQSGTQRIIVKLRGSAGQHFAFYRLDWKMSCLLPPAPVKLGCVCVSGGCGKGDSECERCREGVSLAVNAVCYSSSVNKAAASPHQSKAPMCWNSIAMTMFFLPRTLACYPNVTHS